MFHVVVVAQDDDKVVAICLSYRSRSNKEVLFQRALYLLIIFSNEANKRDVNEKTISERGSAVWEGSRLF